MAQYHPKKKGMVINEKKKCGYPSLPKDKRIQTDFSMKK